MDDVSSSELAPYLQSYGLDNVDYWIPQLKEQGITTIESLEHCHHKLQILAELDEKLKAKYMLERKALQSLLQSDEEMEEEDVQKEERAQRERRKIAQAAMRRQEVREQMDKENKGRVEQEGKVDEILQKLNKAKSEGKDRQDAQIEKLESDLCSLLQVPPEAWISQTKSLDELIAAIHTYFERSKKIRERDWLSEKELLEHCSGGKAFHGVLLTKYLSDQLESRDVLMDVPEKIEMTYTTINEEDIKHFSSIQKENEYQKKVDILGCNVVAAPNAPVYGNVVISSETASHGSEEGEEFEQGMYLSTVKHFTMHTASCFFKITDFKLSESAKEKLVELSEIVETKGDDHSDVYEACIRLFQIYGSHATLGPYNFGGHFWWTCSSQTFEENARENIQMMQKDAILTTDDIAFLGFGVSMNINIDNIKEKYEGKLTEDILATTQLQMMISGGPPEAGDIASWKIGLKKYNSTWVLTDRGLNMTAIWDIIEVNHEQEFGHLKGILQSSWEKMTELRACIFIYPDSESVLQLIGEWNEKGTMLSAHNIQKHLNFLCDVKKKTVQKTGGIQYWFDTYLTQSALQEFIGLIVDAKLDFHVDLKKIKLALKELIDIEELDKLSFPRIKDLANFLYSQNIHEFNPSEIADFPSFDTFLEKILKKETVRQSLYQDLEQELAQSVQWGINHLRSRFKSYEDILITLLMHPYQHNADQVKPLSFNDLKVIKEQFLEAKKWFESYSTDLLKLQSYLLLLAIKQSGKKNYKELLQPTIALMKGLDLPRALKPELSDHIDRCCSGQLDAQYLELARDLESVLESGELFQTPSYFDSNSSLMYALQTKCNHEKQHLHEDRSNLFKACKSAHELMERIGLCKLYPKKLKLQDALCIRPRVLKASINNTAPTGLEQLPYLVLHKLMSYDYECMSDLMRVSSSDTDSDTEEESTPNANEISPIDCLLALILCSDDFLCQDLFSRLAKCQLALPFLLPDPFTRQLNIPLWAMCSIIKEWKVKKESKEIEELTHSIVSYPMPIISFLRFGKAKVRGASKSRILNDIISESSYHNFFFNYDCPGGQYPRILGEGLVDMCCYFPAAKSSDAFPNATAFLNLHGDARNYPDQTGILSQISSMCFILITETDLTFNSDIQATLQMFSSSPGGITILNDSGEEAKKLRTIFSSIKMHITDLTSKSTFQIKESVKKRINLKWESSTKSLSSIKELCNRLKSYSIINIDEESNYFKKGSFHAEKLKKIIIEHKDDKISTKEVMLPLQGGDMWKAWAVLDKELHRQIQRGKEKIEVYSAKIASKKAVIRNEQLVKADSLTPVMESFVTSLLSLGDTIFRRYFLQCLKLELNNLSRESISGMQNKYQSARRELSSLQEKSGSKDSGVQKLIKERKNELELLQEKIVEFSFGLEHLLRELGQVYEAALQSHTKYGENLSRLPKAAAELLIDGHPLEVMDGDAAHVPLQWLNAVLKEAVAILGDPKVFVLSVLGLQSTGKSTLMNTTFGVQFNVSAGRCTRGAFMQLLPFDEEMKEITQCSHVLIVDTEGLRAPELDPLKTQKHDNELATFVIGLANTTLINIYGEVAGDMDDILQTSVHAFLRMNVVKYHPSCRFVHQNAGANIKGEVGRAKFTQKLNQFTLDAAKEEKCESQYESFNDVIHFNDQTDVGYFPGLWKGDPPMAPVNQGYSNAAQTLKQQLVKTIENAGSQCLSSFKGRAEDLWNTLLKENFVFSFKNNLEITAYRSLETTFSKWEWKFQEHLLKWELTTGNEINAESDETVNAFVNQKLEEMQNYTYVELYEPIKIEMEEVFNGKQSEVLVQWKANFQRKLENLPIQLIQSARKYCTKLLNTRQAISQFQEARKYDAEKIKTEVKQYIEKLREEKEELYCSLEEGSLKPEQLKSLLKRKLFTTQKLTLYVNQQIITEHQHQRISTVIEKAKGQLSASNLKEILVGSILSVDQVRKILETAKETEYELQVKFEAIWDDLIRKLPPAIKEPDSIESQIQMALTSHVKEYEGQLIGKVNTRELRKWGRELKLTVLKSYHFNKLTSRFSQGKEYLSRKWHGTSDPDTIEAREMTQKIFAHVENYLQTTTKKETDFNSAFVTEMLILIDEKITASSESVKDRFTFTLDYRLEMLLVACSYSIVYFEQMARLFAVRNDPLVYLEKHVREPMFTMFRDQYYQTRVEEAVANSLCAYLKEPIVEQIRRSIGTIMVSKMKGSYQYFSSKMALKVKILTDLHKQKNFSFFMYYVDSVKKCLGLQIEAYAIAFCDEVVSNGSTNLQLTQKEQVTDLVSAILDVVTSVNDKNIEDWLSNFCRHKTLLSRFGVTLEPHDLFSGDSATHQLDLDNFKSNIKAGLTELKERLHNSFKSIQCAEEMINWSDKPYELLNSLVGCTAQCPFCGEQCDLTDPQHFEKDGQKHQTEIHRMNGLAGWRNKYSKVLCTSFCPVNVDSDAKFSKPDGTYHPYKKYQDVYPEWSIPPDKAAVTSLYWKWFVGKYPDELAEKFNAKPPEVLSHWKELSWEEVEVDLKEIYKL